MREKVEFLLDLQEDGERRLAENRKRDLGKYRERALEYANAMQHLVTPKTQEALRLR